MKRFVSNQSNFLLFKMCLTLLTKMRWKLFPSWKASSKKWRKAKDVRVYSNRKSKVECFTLIKLVIHLIPKWRRIDYAFVCMLIN